MISITDELEKDIVEHKSVIPCKFIAIFILPFSSSKTNRVVATKRHSNKRGFASFLVNIVTNVKKIFVMFCNNNNTYFVRWIK